MVREENVYGRKRLPLPPESVTVRWNTWLNAALFYCDNFEKTADFLESLEAQSRIFRAAKNLFKDPHWFLELAYLKGHFPMRFCLEVNRSELYYH